MTTIELFSHLSNIVTVIAFLLAALQFFLWRKQQRYSLELEALLNMEDFFEIYTASLMKVHGYFDKACKLASEAEGKNKEDRRNLNEDLNGPIKDIIYASVKDTNERSESYSLARFRVIRLNFDVKETNELDPEWLSGRFNDFITEETSLEDVAKEISIIKNVACEKFKSLRDSI